MLIKIYRGETNCSLAETQSMGQTNLHDYEYSWACGVSICCLVSLSILPSWSFAKRRDSTVLVLCYADIFYEHLTKKVILLEDTTCCLAELEQDESTIMLKAQYWSWITAKQLIYIGFMQLCLTDTVKRVWEGWWSGIGKDFPEMTRTLCCCGFDTEKSCTNLWY